jgi:hypothetical protein
MAKLRRRKPQADGITVRRKSRALFQQHRPITDIIKQKAPDDAGALNFIQN